MAAFEPVDGVPARAPLLSLRSAARLITDNGHPAVGAPDDAPQRWRGGIGWASEPCDVGGVYDDCSGETATGTEKDMPDRTGEGTYVPFTVFAGYSCSAHASTALDFRAKASAHLEAITDFQVEREFWRGDLAQAVPNAANAYLADANVDELSSACLLPVEALGLLEEALASLAGGGEGMIHAPRIVVTHWDALRLLTREGNILRTVVGTIVVPGVGYDGSDPDGTVPSGSRWVYATDRASLRLSDIKVYPESDMQAMNRATNDIEYRAERFAAPTFDGCRHFGLPVCLTEPGGS